MPKCIECKEKWTWKQSMRSIVTFSRFISCPYCAKKQMLTSMTRISILLLVFVPYITMPYVIEEEVKSSAVAIGIAIYLFIDLTDDDAVVNGFTGNTKAFAKIRSKMIHSKNAGF